MDKYENEQNNYIKALVETGSEITGSVAGAVLGTILAGIPGAIIGGTSGPLISNIFKKVGNEVKQRLFGNRELVRIGAAYTFAIDRINQNLSQGFIIRKDSFFTNEKSKRSAAEEILEGTLKIAQDEHEELKVKHYGNLIASIAFDETIDRAMANLLLKTAQSLSFRQLCIIEIFNDKDKAKLKIVPPKTDQTSWFEAGQHVNKIINQPTYAHYHLLLNLRESKIDLSIEFEELKRIGIIDSKDTSFRDYDSTALTRFGKMIRKLMGLNEIKQIDMDGISHHFRYHQNPYSII